MLIILNKNVPYCKIISIVLWYDENVYKIFGLQFSEGTQNLKLPIKGSVNTSTLQHVNTSTLQHFNTSTLQHFNTSTLH